MDLPLASEHTGLLLRSSGDLQEAACVDLNSILRRTTRWQCMLDLWEVVKHGSFLLSLRRETYGSVKHLKKALLCTTPREDLPCCCDTSLMGLKVLKRHLVRCLMEDIYGSALMTDSGKGHWDEMGRGVPEAVEFGPELCLNNLPSPTLTPLLNHKGATMSAPSLLLLPDSMISLWIWTWSKCVCVQTSP